jgi:hypothetical protein
MFYDAMLQIVRAKNGHIKFADYLTMKNKKQFLRREILIVR